MNVIKRLVSDPLYLKLWMIVIGVLNILVLPAPALRVLTVIARLWAAVYLLWDLLHERRFLKGFTAPLPMVVLFAMMLSISINVLRGGQLLLEFKYCILYIIFFCVFAAPSAAKSEEERSREVSIICNSVMILSLLPVMLAAIAYFVKINLYVPWLMVEPGYQYEYNGSGYNTLWHERFFSLFSNPNNVSVSLLAVGICALINFNTAKAKTICARLQKILCATTMVCVYVCLIALASRGAKLSASVAVMALSGVLIYRLINLKGIKRLTFKICISVIGGILAFGLTFGVLEASAIIQPIAATKIEESLHYVMVATQHLVKNTFGLFHTAKPESERIQPIKPTPRSVRKEDYNSGFRVRFMIYKLYIYGLRHHFVFGAGVENEELFFDIYQKERPEQFQAVLENIPLPPENVLSAHNTYIYFISCYGIVAFVPFILLVAIIVLRTLKISAGKEYSGFSMRYRLLFLAFLAAVFTMGMCGTYLFDYDLSAIFAWIAVGYLNASGSSTKVTRYLKERLINYVRHYEHK